MKKNLVIYYSRKGENYVDGKIVDLPIGNTKVLAEYISEAVDADLFEVETVKAYAKEYTECTKEAKEELNRNERPELKSYLEDITQYENIVVAGPCWWGTYPCAIFSQLERLDFTGKKVYPVMSHEGSGLAGSASALRRYCKGAQVGPGLAVKGSETKASAKLIKEWAKNNLQ